LLLLAVSARRHVRRSRWRSRGPGDGVSTGGTPRILRIATARSCARR